MGFQNQSKPLHNCVQSHLVDMEFLLSLLIVDERFRCCATIQANISAILFEWLALVHREE